MFLDPIKPRSQGLFPGLGASQGKGPGNEVADKTRAARFLNGFNNIPQKSVSWESEQRFKL